jgi:hypothetical protein
MLLAFYKNVTNGIQWAQASLEGTFFEEWF